MGEIKVPYLVRKGGHYYWQPNKLLKDAGFKSRPLGKNKERAAAHAMEINAGVSGWRAGNEKVPCTKGTVPWLINAYMKDERYTALRPNTRHGYAQHLEKIKEWGFEVPVAGIARQDCIKYYRAVKDKSQSLANARMRVLSVLMQFAVDEGHIAINPASKMRLSAQKPRSEVWTAQEIDAAIKAADAINKPSIGLAIMLMVYTGQRVGDVRAMTWNQYDGNSIEVMQEKTGAYLKIRCHAKLKGYMNKAKKKRTSVNMLIAEATGKPYDKFFLGKMFQEVRTAAGIRKQLQLRDLRRTAVVNLKRAGCTTGEIASITGHSESTVTEMMRIYSPRDAETASNAIAKMEAYKQKKLEK